MSWSDARLEQPMAPRCRACGNCGFKFESEEQCLPLFFRKSLTTSAAMEHFAGRTQEGRRATISDLLLAGVRPGAIMNLTRYSRGQIRGVPATLGEQPRHGSPTRKRTSSSQLGDWPSSSRRSGSTSRALVVEDHGEIAGAKLPGRGGHRSYRSPNSSQGLALQVRQTVEKV